MKKIISVHLGNKMFQIEEDAYAYLNRVLNAQWKKQEFEELVADRLEQKLVGGKTVVTYLDVADVLYQLGVLASEHKETASTGRAKRLYRQENEKMIAGVCTGLAEYLEVDPVLVRVLFVIALFLGSVGFWIYVILWIIVPKVPKMLND